MFDKAKEFLGTYEELDQEAIGKHYKNMGKLLAQAHGDLINFYLAMIQGEKSGDFRGRLEELGTKRKEHTKATQELLENWLCSKCTKGMYQLNISCKECDGGNGLIIELLKMFFADDYDAPKDDLIELISHLDILVFLYKHLLPEATIDPNIILKLDNAASDILWCSGILITHGNYLAEDRERTFSQRQKRMELEKKVIGFVKQRCHKDPDWLKGRPISFVVAQIVKKLDIPPTKSGRHKNIENILKDHYPQYYQNLPKTTP